MCRLFDQHLYYCEFVFTGATLYLPSACCVFLFVRHSWSFLKAGLGLAVMLSVFVFYAMKINDQSVFLS